MFVLTRTLLISLLVTIFLSSCSSQPKLEFQEIFHTNIQDDDSKMFTFTLISLSSQKGKTSQQGKANREGAEGRRNGGREGGREGGQTNHSDSTNRNVEDEIAIIMAERLEIRLEENQYCRAGYIKLETSFNKTIFSISGECHESATEEDRALFLNRD